MWIVTKVTIQTHSRRKATMTLPDNVTLDLDDLAIPASAGQPFAVTNDGTGWTVWCRQEMDGKEATEDVAEASSGDRDTEPAMPSAEAGQTDGKTDVPAAAAAGSAAKADGRKPRKR